MGEYKPDFIEIVCYDGDFCEVEVWSDQKGNEWSVPIEIVRDFDNAQIINRKNGGTWYNPDGHHRKEYNVC